MAESTIAPLGFAVNVQPLSDSAKVADQAATSFKGVSKAADDSATAMDKATKAAKDVAEAHRLSGKELQGHIEAYKSTDDVISELTKKYGSLGRATEEAVQAANKGLKGGTGFEVLRQWRAAVAELAEAHKNLADHAERAGRHAGGGGAHGGPHGNIGALLTTLAGTQRHGVSAFAGRLGEQAAGGILGGMGLGGVAAAGGIAIGVGVLAEKLAEMGKEALKVAEANYKMEVSFTAFEKSVTAAQSALRVFREEGQKSQVASSADFVAGAAEFMATRNSTGLDPARIAMLTDQSAKLNALSGNSSKQLPGFAKELAAVGRDGVVSMTELNSLFEKSRALQNALEEATGKTGDQLLQAAAKGAMSFDEMIGHIESVKDKTDNLASGLVPTFGDSFAKIKDSFVEMLGEMLDSEGWRGLERKFADLAQQASNLFHSPSAPSVGRYGATSLIPGVGPFMAAGMGVVDALQRGAEAMGGGADGVGGMGTSGAPAGFNARAFATMPSTLSGQTPATSAAAAASSRMSLARFNAIAQYTLPGYRFTGGYRTEADEARLRASGALTTRPGVPTAHAIGNYGSPGAIDFNIGENWSQSQMASWADINVPGHGQVIHERAAGGQGAHWHIALQRGGGNGATRMQGIDALGRSPINADATALAQAQRLRNAAADPGADPDQRQVWLAEAQRLEAGVGGPIAQRNRNLGFRQGALASGLRGGAAARETAALGLNQSNVGAGYGDDIQGARGALYGEAMAGAESDHYDAQQRIAQIARMTTAANQGGSAVWSAKIEQQVLDWAYQTWGVTDPDRASPAVKAAIDTKRADIFRIQVSSDQASGAQAALAQRQEGSVRAVTASSIYGGVTGYARALAEARARASVANDNNPYSGAGDRVMTQFMSDQQAAAAQAADPVIQGNEAMGRRLGMGSDAGSRVRYSRQEQLRTASLGYDGAAQAGRLAASFGLQDANTLKDVRDADAQRTQRMREQLTLVGMVGDKYEVEARLLTEIADLQAKGVTVTSDMANAERDRLAAVLEVEQSYERQMRQQNDLQAISKNAGRGAGLGLRGLADQAFSGKLTGQGVLNAASGWVKNIGLDVLQATVFDKIENGVEDTVEGFVGKIGGIFGGKKKGGLIGSLVDAASGRDASVSSTAAAQATNGLAAVADSAGAAAAALSKLSLSAGGSAGSGTGSILKTIASAALSIFGGGGATGGKGSLSMSQLNVKGHALGDVLGSPTIVHVGGEGGDEAVLPLRRGADGRLGVASGGGQDGGVQIVVNDMRTGKDSAPVQTQTQRQPNGRRIVRMTIRDEVKGAIADGSMDPAFNKQYGIPRQVARR